MSVDSLYKLDVISGADEGETVVLYGSSIKIIGGESTCLNAEEGWLSIKDRSIGGLQAVLTWDSNNQVYTISNRSAISPIVVNGKACANAILINGTTIEIGRSVLRVEAPAGYRGPTSANICEITSASDDDIYLGDSQPQQVRKRTTPAWLLCGDDAPDLPELTMERVTSDDYWESQSSSALLETNSTEKRADMYAPVSRAGRPPGPLPVADSDAAKAQKLGISLQIYRQALNDGFDPALYAQACREGIEPHVYMQAVQSKQDPHLYAKACGLGLEPEVYIEALNKGYDPFTYNQFQTNNTSLEKKSAESQSSDAYSEAEGFAHLFVPPPPPALFSKTAPKAAVPIFEANTIVSSAEKYELESGDIAEVLESDPVDTAEQPATQKTADTSQRHVEREVVSSPDEYQDENGNHPRGRLVVVYGANRGLTLNVYGNVAIGRAGDNDFVLSDLAISRRHCSIQFLEDGVYLVNHSTSSTTKLGRTLVKTRARLDKESSITLANKVRIHWESYDKNSR
ncbi:MAG: FHA domain-containing protein [Candidatus Bruticola sp.]